MGTDVHAPNGIALDVKNHPEVCLDAYREDRLAVGGGKFVDFVGAKPGVKRVFFEDLEYGFGASLLGWQQLGQCTAERFCRPEPVAHSA